MTDEKSDESNAEGEKVDTPVTPVEEVNKNYEALKAANDKVAAELLRKEELKAKIAIGGESNAGQEAEKPKEETPHEYRIRIEKEMAEGKTEFGD